MKRRYGLLGLLSLIGVLGLVSGNRAYLPFLAWAVFFRYLFVEADEMFTANLGRAAAWAFYLQLAATTGVTLLAAGRGQPPETALLRGIGAGFGLALMGFALLAAWFEWRERPCHD